MALSKRWLLLLAVPAAIACNGIIGLNDFEKGECPGARCTNDAGFGDLDVSQPDATPFDGSLPDAGPGTAPVSWAKWPMPNYDGGPGFPMSYVVTGSMTVTDDVTKLVWRAQTLPISYRYEDAVKGCAQLADGPWRLPKRIELVTLLDYTRTPRINSAFQVSTEKLWTSSEVRPFDPKAPSYWVVDFDTGIVRAQAVNDSITYRALCVKGT